MKQIQFLIDGPIQNSEMAKIDLVDDLSIGGRVFFLGVVRNDEIDGKKVKEIVYSVYEDMVQKQMTEIVETILMKYSDILRICIFHSKGTVKVGEASLYVSISGCHRKQAFLAIAETVDLIKANVPIWKKEIFEDNSFRWIE